MLLMLNGVASTTAHSTGILPSMNTYQEDSPSAGLISLNGDEPWNNTAEGFMWVRAVPSDLSASSGDQFVIDLDNNSSNPSAGIRIREGDDDEQGQRYRDDSGNLASGNLDHARVIEGAMRTFGYSWSNAEGKVRIIGGGDYKEYSFTPDSGAFAAGGFDRLYIGSRNGNNDSFSGSFDAFEVGDTFLSFGALGARMNHENQINVVTGGQSLMSGHFEGQEAGSDSGYATLSTTAYTTGGKELVVINGATGSSALSNRNTSDPDNYWYNEDTSTYGQAYATWLAAGREISFTPDWVFWAQGEQDSFSVGKSGEMTKAAYKALLFQVFTKMRADVNPTLQIGIQGIGRRSDGFTDSNIGGIQAIREAQQELAAETDWIHMLGYSYHAALTDSVHLSDAGYASVAETLMRRALEVDGVSVSGSTIGPQITGASRAGTSVTVSLSHDGGDDFTPSSGIVGFRFFDDGSEITISNAVRTNATTVTLTLASTPSGTEELYYCWDDADDITNGNLANVLRDNSAETLPLVPAKITL